ncbi:hypothetical protein BV911_06160 [Pseudoruegeria sp. SK021]|nr:hypothetical protein BV911_06160 [Pseudoruegeria sp. SK021]
MKPRHILLIAGAILAFPILTAGAVHAGKIENACVDSGRRGATRSVCTCIQSVANRTLTNRDQRIAASFFKDPHRAQEVRQSDRSTDESFWKRYKAFGSVASQSCG